MSRADTPDPDTPRARLQRIARQAMRDRGFEPDFAPAVLEQLQHLPAPSSGGGPRRDLRDLPWASIDNDDSRDLDQLSVAESVGDGSTRILVAVADVDALVPAGSAVDQRAAGNTTSIYTAAQVFPMLPERLSTDLTSLGEHEDRCAVVVEMRVTAQGSVAASTLYTAVVRNFAKLAYNSVAPWLEGSGPVPAAVAAVPGLDANLRAQDGAARSLRQARHQHGALTLHTVEAKPIFEGDAIRDLAIERPNRAKELIEDFMIAANGATADFIASRHYPSLRRVVRQPKRWPRIVALAAETGGELPEQPDARALEEWLEQQRAKGEEHFAEVSLSVVKLLGRGEYVVERPGDAPVGHFGLAVPNYAHTTAPNRRYADLITQRILKAALGGQPVPYTSERLVALAQHCTEREDAANAVERQVRKSATALLLDGRIGDTFDAIVTGASSKGTWVRVGTPPIEGRLEQGFEGADVGERLRVRLLSTDVTRGFIDFARA